MGGIIKIINLILQMSNFHFPKIAALLAVSALSACGGGGSNNASRSLDIVLNDAPDINTVSVDSGPTSRWSDPATWGGSVPADGADIMVPRGQTIILDRNVSAATLTVNGTLICDNRDLELSARWIMVHGKLECGTESEPFQNQFNITLTGNDRNESVMGMGTKTLSTMGGGIISLHGQPRTSWLMLDGTVNPGSRDIRTEYPTGWRKGDVIVVSSTDDSMHHAETHVIDSIDGTSIRLNQAMQYRHFGEVQSFHNGQRNWEVDTRAEVALLSRNIRIQGDEASEQNRFGAHVMIMEGSIGLISGVEFRRVGQEGILGRYPFHWHHANNVEGQYIRNSSIVRSYNRCITVHASHNALVEDNVCMDHVGHGYFLEDGGETGNVFKNNLGLVTRRPRDEVALIPSDIQQGEAARGPSTFWISNPDNTFIGNAAAGSDGLGFWYDTEETVTGSSASLSRYQGISPMYSKFGVFKDNRVHSSDMGFSSCSLASGPAGYLPPTRANYHNLTVFAGGDGSVWPCEGNQIFTELKVTDTGHAHHAGFVAPRPVTVQDSLFVANSKLSEGGRGRQRSAIGIYDFGVDLRDVHFVNFNNEYGGNFMFGARDADVRITSNPVSGITLADSYLYYDRRNRAEDMRPSAWGAVIHDEDGSFGLGADTALVADHPLMTDSTCTDVFATGRLCDNRYVRVKLDFAGRKNLPPAKHLRSDGREAIGEPLMERAHYQSVVSVNHNRYHYAYEFDASVLSAGSLTASMQFAHDQDTAVLEFRNLPSNASVRTSGYSAANNIDALKQGPGGQFLRQGQSLFVKMKAKGERWSAKDQVSFGW